MTANLSLPERRAVAALASIYFLRMLGLFLVLPVLAVHSQAYADATPMLIGIAVGIYGLTQALLQIPFGLASDRLGRRPVIVFGLVLFALGSVIAAQADSVIGIIIGRAVQGSGAIAAAVLALNADLTREESRTRAMAVIGMSIGLAFFVSLLLGPLLSGVLGLSGLFWVTALLAGLGLLIVLLALPATTAVRLHRDAMPVWGELHGVIRHGELLRLDFGILALHAILTALFVAVPLALQALRLPVASHWQVYAAVLLLSIAGAVPMLLMAERHRRMKPVFVAAVALLALALHGLIYAHHTVVWIGVWLTVFFIAFNVLEASLPSLVSKVAPAQSKGSAMGVYATSQFLGAFLGGLLGGLALAHYGLAGVFGVTAVIAVLWLAVAVGMRSPRYLTSRVLRLPMMDEAEARALGLRLSQVGGVVEAVVFGDQGVAYLKVDKGALDEAQLAAIASPSA